MATRWSRFFNVLGAIVTITTGRGALLDEYIGSGHSSISHESYGEGVVWHFENTEPRGLSAIIGGSFSSRVTTRAKINRTIVKGTGYSIIYVESRGYGYEVHYGQAVSSINMNSVSTGTQSFLGEGISDSPMFLAKGKAFESFSARGSTESATMSTDGIGVYDDSYLYALLDFDPDIYVAMQG